MRKAIIVLVSAGAMLGIVGCSTKTGTAAAVGVGAGGAAYEYSNKRAMDDLNKQRDAGKISQEEYDRRKQEIEKRSAVY